MYQIVAVDLDETLLNDEHEPCMRNQIAIAKAREKGVYIVPCSGRGPGFLGNLLETLDLRKKGEYSILCNGAIIVDNEKDEIIACDPLPFSDVEKLFHYGKDHQLCIQVFTPDTVYFFDADEEEKARGRSFGNNIVFREDHDISDLKDKIIMKLLFERVDMPYLHSLEAELDEIMQGSIAISFSSNRYMELNKKGVNKGTGLKQLADYLHIDIKDTIGIGDNYNDLDLLKCAGLSVAMANANEVAKNVADIITQADNNEGGVGEIIENYILNK